MLTGGTRTVHEHRVEKKGVVVSICSKVTGLALLTDLNKVIWAAFFGKGR